MNILKKIGSVAKNNAGTINTLSGIYGAANLISKLTGGQTMGLGQGYRPSQWPSSRMSSTALVQKYTNVGGVFFDAIISESVEDTLTICQHPTQLGANISDHAYRNPTKITMSVGISDAMGNYSMDGYPGSGTKSSRAYDWLIEIQRLRIPIKVRTHFKNYENMLITSVSYDHDSSTTDGLRATLQLEEIMMVSVGTEKVSAREWTSASQKNSQQQAEELKERESIYAGATGTGEKGLRQKMGGQT